MTSKAVQFVRIFIHLVLKIVGCFSITLITCGWPRRLIPDLVALAGRGDWSRPSVHVVPLTDDVVDGEAGATGRLFRPSDLWRQAGNKALVQHWCLGGRSRGLRRTSFESGTWGSQVVNRRRQRKRRARDESLLGRSPPEVWLGRRRRNQMRRDTPRSRKWCPKVLPCSRGAVLAKHDGIWGQKCGWRSVMVMMVVVCGSHGRGLHALLVGVLWQQLSGVGIQHGSPLGWTRKTWSFVPFSASQETSIVKHVLGHRIQGPIISLPRIARLPGNFHKTVIEG